MLLDQIIEGLQHLDMAVIALLLSAAEERRRRKMLFVYVDALREILLVELGLVNILGRIEPVPFDGLLLGGTAVGAKLIDEDLLLGGRLLDQRRKRQTALKQALPVLILTDLHENVETRCALLLLLVRDQPFRALVQPVIVHLHQKSDHVLADIGRLEAQHILQHAVVLIAQFHLADDPVRRRACVGFLVPDLEYGGVPLDLGLRIADQKLHLASLGIGRGVDIRKERAKLVLLVLVAQSGCYGDKRADHIAARDLLEIPRKYTGVELDRLLRHLLKRLLQIGVQLLRLAAVGKIPKKNSLRAPVLDDFPHRALLEEIPQGQSKHIQLARVRDDKRLRNSRLVFSREQFTRKIRRRHDLRMRSFHCDLLHDIDRGRGAANGLRPERKVDLHHIVRCQRFAADIVVIQALRDQRKRLAGDTLEVLASLRDQACPRADGAFHGRVADQVIVRNDADDVPKRVIAAHIARLTDCLAQTFLKLGRKQQLARKLVELMIVRHEHRAEHRIRDLVGHTAVYHVGDVPDRRRVSDIDVIRDIEFVMMIGERVKAVHLRLAHLTLEIIGIRRVALRPGVALHDRADLGDIDIIPVRPEGAAIPPFREGVLAHVVNLIQKRRHE